jgi:hypothetical protein
MTHVDELLARQAQWQRSRRNLSWPEKIREAERLRPSLEAFRRMRMNRDGSPAGQAQGQTAAPAVHDSGHRGPIVSDDE